MNNWWQPMVKCCNMLNKCWKLMKTYYHRLDNWLKPMAKGWNRMENCVKPILKVMKYHLFWHTWSTNVYTYLSWQIGHPGQPPGKVGTKSSQKGSREPIHHPKFDFLELLWKFWPQKPGERNLSYANAKTTEIHWSWNDENHGQVVNSVEKRWKQWK